MRVHRTLFPILLLLIFFGVIALGIAAGFWQPGQGGHGQTVELLTWLL